MRGSLLARSLCRTAVLSLAAASAMTRDLPSIPWIARALSTGDESVLPAGD